MPRFRAPRFPALRRRNRVVITDSSVLERGITCGSVACTRSESPLLVRMEVCNLFEILYGRFCSVQRSEAAFFAIQMPRLSLRILVNGCLGYRYA